MYVLIIEKRDKKIDVVNFETINDAMEYVKKTDPKKIKRIKLVRGTLYDRHTYM